MSSEHIVEDPRSVATRRASSLVLSLATVGLVVAVLGAAVIARGRTFGIGMPDPPMALADLPQIMAADPGIGNTFTVVDLPFLVRLLCAVPSVLLAVVSFVAALLLVRVLRDIADGLAFRASARPQLARLSLTLILGGLLCALTDLAAMVALTVLQANQALGGSGDTFGIALPSVPIFLISLGVVAAAVDYALKDGARLEQEVEGVV